MRTWLTSLLLFVAWAAPAGAQAPLAGTWQGRLEVAPGQSIVIHFVISAAPGGAYTAVVTSPDEGAVKNVRAGAVRFADQRLTIDVPALAGQYAGTWRNGVIEGEWSQEGSRLPLSLKPLDTSGLTRAQIELLRGEWSGPLSSRGIAVTIVLRFTVTDGGVLRAVMDVPEQGVKNWETQKLTLDDDHFTVEIPAAMAKVTGTLEPTRITGHWSQLSVTSPLTLTKGRFVAQPVYLSLPASARTPLSGRWRGNLGPMTLVASFQWDAQGRAVGQLDIPQQNVSNIPISEARLDGTRLTFRAAGFGATYTGELAADKLTGEWVQAGLPKPVPLALAREK